MSCLPNFEKSLLCPVWFSWNWAVTGYHLASDIQHRYLLLETQKKRLLKRRKIKRRVCTLVTLECRSALTFWYPRKTIMVSHFYFSFIPVERVWKCIRISIDNPLPNVSRFKRWHSSWKLITKDKITQENNKKFFRRSESRTDTSRSIRRNFKLTQCLINNLRT